MKFKIKHSSKLFFYGIVIPAIVFSVALLIFILLGFDFSNETAAMIFTGIFAVSAVTAIIFIILYTIEQLFGAKIIVENDHVDIRMLLRRRKLRFDDIADAKYYHYEGSRYPKLHLYYSKYLHNRYIYNAQKGRKYYRSSLDFILSSGKVINLNDKATGYAKKRKLAMSDPNIDPDEDVKLYQAYQCFLNVYRRF